MRRWVKTPPWRVGVQTQHVSVTAHGPRAKRCAPVGGCTSGPRRQNCAGRRECCALTAFSPQVGYPPDSVRWSSEHPCTGPRATRVSRVPPASVELARLRRPGGDRHVAGVQTENLGGCGWENRIAGVQTRKTTQVTGFMLDLEG